MNLMLDIGNTAVKWGCIENGKLGATGWFVHRDGDVGSLATGAWTEFGVPDQVFIASVAGKETEDTLAAWCAGHWQRQPVYLHVTHEACGVRNAYHNPGQLGIDRWTAVIAAHHDYPGTVCVVDCGTAITLDLVTGEGEHRGGLILPGIEVLQQMLLHNTAGLSLSTERPAPTPLAKTTAAALEGGAAYLVVAALERIVADMCAEQNTDIAIVITGGDAMRVLSLLHGPVHHEPHLVLRGIAILAGVQ